MDQTGKTLKEDPGREQTEIRHGKLNLEGIREGSKAWKVESGGKYTKVRYGRGGWRGTDIEGRHEKWPCRGTERSKTCKVDHREEHTERRHGKWSL